MSTKMDPELKAKWLESLRSGKYEQARGTLRNSHNQFCCLGVLCDVIDPNGWGSEIDGRFGLWIDPVNGSESGGAISSNTISRIGMDEDVEDSKQGHLIQMNDGDRSFLEIANWIEEHL